MMLMLNEYKRIAKYTQDPNDISGDYKHVKANSYQEVEITLNKHGSYDIAVYGGDMYISLGQGTLHKSPLLGDYIEFEIGVML